MDGFHSRGKEWHLQKVGVILPLLLVPMFYDGDLGWLITGYVLIRIGLFDLLNNVFAGRDLNHRGYNWWDNLVGLFDSPLAAELFGRAVFLFTGILMIIQ